MGKARRGPDGNRRVEKRYPRRVRVRFWGDGFEGTGHTKDVSLTGLLLEAGRYLDPGTRLRLELNLEDGPFACEAIVERVKRVPPQARTIVKPTLGLKFLPAEWAIQRLIGEEVEEPAVGSEEEPPQLPDTLELDLRDLEVLQHAYDQDIKHGGLRVYTSERFPVDADVCVPVHLPSPHGTIDCLGTVVKVFDDGFAMRLAEVDPVRERISEILKEG